MQDSGSNNPPKKPATNPDALYLRERLKFQLEQCNSGPISRKDFETKWEHLRDLARRFRQCGIFNARPALVAAAMLVAFLVFQAQRISSREYSFAAPIDKFRILERFDGYNYLFRKVHRDQAGKVATSLVHAKFCQGYEPPLSAG